MNSGEGEGQVSNILTIVDSNVVVYIPSLWRRMHLIVQSQTFLCYLALITLTWMPFSRAKHFFQC